MKVRERGNKRLISIPHNGVSYFGTPELNLGAMTCGLHQ